MYIQNIILTGYSGSMWIDLKFHRTSYLSKRKKVNNNSNRVNNRP